MNLMNIVQLKRIDEIDMANRWEMVFDYIDFEYTKTRYIFNEPYRLIIRKEKGDEISPWYYCAEDESLDISVAEESLEEAINSFYSDIDFLWQRYANAEDSKLYKKATLLKNNINGLIREIIKYDDENKGN